KGSSRHAGWVERWLRMDPGDPRPFARRQPDGTASTPSVAQEIVIQSPGPVKWPIRARPIDYTFASSSRVLAPSAPAGEDGGGIWMAQHLATAHGGKLVELLASPERAAEL